MSLVIKFWLVLTVIVLIYPSFLLGKYLIQKTQQFYKYLKQKVEELRMLSNIKTEFLDKVGEDNLLEQVKKVVDGSEDKQELTQKKKKLLENLLQEAVELKKAGKLEEYEKKLIEGLSIDSENVEFNQRLADLYFSMEKYNKTLSLLKKIINIQPDNHYAIWQLGEIYLIKGDFETAKQLVEKAIGLQPSAPKYYISLAEIYYNLQKKREAANIMEKVVRLRPTNTTYLFTLANLYEELGDIDNARKYYFKVLEVEPTNEKAKKKLKDLTSDK